MSDLPAKDGQSLLLSKMNSKPQHVSSMEDFTALGGLTLRSRPQHNKTTAKKVKTGR